MTDEEKWEVWRNANSEIQKSYWGSIHKHIIWYQGVDRRKAFLDGLTEGRKELEQWKQEWQDAQIKANEEGFARTTLQIKCSNLEKENAELKEKLKHRNCIDCSNHGNQIEVLKLKARMEKMKKSCLDVMKVQGINLTDDYMAGMYNGMVIVYNSCFLNGFNELEMDFCSKNENGKWELAE